jgi:Zn-dependent protease/predicted transcriptional regulator
VLPVALPRPGVGSTGVRMDGRKPSGTRTGSDASSTGWALEVGKAMGIPIRIHFTFLLLLAWFGFTATTRGESPLRAVLFLLLLFACVVLHELGHAAVALRFGVRTREIVLYPIGGIARLENIPGGKAELLIALAGPLVNLALAVVLFAAMRVIGMPLLPEPERILSPGNMAQQLLVANLMLFGFNLVPAFPMDGGRVLRASLSLALTEERATNLAAAVGQGVAILLGAVGLFTSNWVLLFIALFVFLGAAQEVAFHRRRAMVIGRTAREAMITRFETLAPQDSLGRAAEHLLATHQQDFPVVDAWGRVAGVLSRARLMHGLAREGSGGAVLDAMGREFTLVSPGTDLEEVLRGLQNDPGTPVLVLDEQRLLGMITLENLAEFIEIARVSRS